MSQQVYQRILKLPCGDVREGASLKTTLDTAVKEVLATICKPADGFKLKVAQDDSGHLQATITRGAHKIEVQGRYGQNTVFKDGGKASFVSYTVRAEAGLATLDRAENAGESLEGLGKIGGVVLAIVAVCALLSWMVRKLGLIIYSVPIFILIVYAGKWAGGKAGRAVANRIQERATNRVLSGDEIEKADAVWERLTNGITTVTSSYPAV
jgi:hypothetical protein